jgi:hypothetical protein
MGGGAAPSLSLRWFAAGLVYLSVGVVAGQVERRLVVLALQIRVRPVTEQTPTHPPHLSTRPGKAVRCKIYDMSYALSPRWLSSHVMALSGTHAMRTLTTGSQPSAHATCSAVCTASTNTNNRSVGRWVGQGDSRDWS